MKRRAILCSSLAALAWRPAAAQAFPTRAVRLVANTPTEAAAFFASETTQWNRVIEAARLQLD